MYSLWYNAPTLMPTSDGVEMELHIESNVLLRMGEFSHERCRVGLKRSVKGICCFLLVAHIVVLVMQRHTNIKLGNISIE
jgi:hypothetical protein